MQCTVFFKCDGLGEKCDGNELGSRESSMVRKFVSRKDAKKMQRRKESFPLRLCVFFASLRETKSLTIDDSPFTPDYSLLTIFYPIRLNYKILALNSALNRIFYQKRIDC
jgi:hypothetical protein